MDKKQARILALEIAIGQVSAGIDVGAAYNATGDDQAALKVEKELGKIQDLLYRKLVRSRKADR